MTRPLCGSLPQLAKYGRLSRSVKILKYSEKAIISPAAGLSAKSIISPAMFTYENPYLA